MSIPLALATQRYLFFDDLRRCRMVNRGALEPLYHKGMPSQGVASLLVLGPIQLPASYVPGPGPRDESASVRRADVNPEEPIGGL